MAKQLMFDEEAWRKALSGVRQLADTVRITLGPTAKYVFLDKKFGAPQVVNDGVTIAKEVELEDPFENVAAKLVHSVAEKTNDTAGDGTATAVLLAEAIYAEGVKQVLAGVNPVYLKRGIDKAVEVAVAELKRMSRPVRGIEDYRHVARIAANNDAPLGDMIAEAIEKVGKEGVVTVEEGKANETTVEFVEGMQFDKGFISPYFINKPQELVCDLEDCALLITDKKISNVQELVPILEKVAQVGKPILIIAEEVEGEALAALVVNRLRGMLRCCAVKAPAFGDRRIAILQDIAVLTGGQLVSDSMGLKLETLKLKQLGTVKKVKVEKEKTTLIGGGGDRKQVEGRMSELRTLIKKATSDYDREKLQERLAKLMGGVAIIKVGGTTESEMKERKYRVEDAVNATKAAAQEGIVAGGGVTFLRAIPAIEKLEFASTDEKAGARIVMKALEAPLFNLAQNSGQDGAVVTAEVKERNDSDGVVGFDAISGNFVNMLDAGIVDATKVARCALQNAASVASLLLTSRTLITELKDKKKKVEGAVK